MVRLALTRSDSGCWGRRSSTSRSQEGSDRSRSAEQGLSQMTVFEKILVRRMKCINYYLIDAESEVTVSDREQRHG